MGKFEFGVSLRHSSDGADWVRKCRRAEELGYDHLTVPDHLGKNRLSPFPALTAAAAVTERVKVGTLVSNVPFYNLALFARDVATTNNLTDGRLELGLGSGHMKHEFDDAGLPWRKAADRITYLAEGLAELRTRLEDEGGMPTLLIAGNSDGVLKLAAEQADIAGFSGLRQERGRPPGTFVLDNADKLAERVGYFRSLAGDRDIQYNMLIQRVVDTEDRRAAAAEWHAETEERSAESIEELLEAPQLLFGTLDEMAEQLVARRERYGFSYFTVFEPLMETFAPVVAQLRGR
ncbi:TIGR03621 family F420-dependent LLM class oxidoreductase [Amycolatopsis benzoatilytica]|uniref:TIGR03621 family F420-dependent LLM class oxidoreductase n=1 Tax=Amycolatopsis benzoatilytica TaxID=346045 RepID=UPI00036A4C49|nr:TIGR03621 family F420-dependent LLM class oxidoreductase [Amycolatopsis benzoatilytica]